MGSWFIGEIICSRGMALAPAGAKDMIDPPRGT